MIFLKTQLAVYVCDTLVTSKQGQGHQTKHELVDIKQGYNHANYERLPSNSVPEKANVKVFVKSDVNSLP